MDKNKIDIEILKALYYGNHLEPHELEIALNLVYLLDKELKSRLRKGGV